MEVEVWVKPLGLSLPASQGLPGPCLLAYRLMGPSPGVPELLLPLDDIVHIHSLLYLPFVELLDLILWRGQR